LILLFLFLHLHQNKKDSSVMSFGNIIEERRKYLQIRQEDLAELCNVSTKTIQKIENDKANPTLKTLQKILDILGMEMIIGIKKLNDES
jgi:transcriptional regulator with XRE-family HTH domain